MVPLIEPERDILPMGGLIVEEAGFDMVRAGWVKGAGKIGGTNVALGTMELGVEGKLVMGPGIAPADSE